METRQVVRPHCSGDESRVLDSLTAATAGLSVNHVAAHGGGATTQLGLRRVLPTGENPRSA